MRTIKKLLGLSTQKTQRGIGSKKTHLSRLGLSSEVGGEKIMSKHLSLSACSDWMVSEKWFMD